MGGCVIVNLLERMNIPNRLTSGAGRLRATLSGGGVTIDRRALAWMAHLYTALGGVIGVFALFAASEGRVRDAFMLLIAAMLIDATDGIFARAVRTRDTLPAFDGAMVDNVIDMLNFVWTPVFIIWSQDLAPAPIWVVIPVIAALYAYGQTNMKTEDSFFLGFPSYWNVVALYLFWFQPVAALAGTLIVVPAILTFIPTRYLYPSRNRALWKTTWTLGAFWFALVIILLQQDAPDPTLVWVSAYYPAYYLAASFYIDWQIRSGARIEGAGDG